MNLDNIKQFIELAKTEGVAELKYEEKDLKIAVQFATAGSVTPVTHIQTPSAPITVNSTVDTVANSDDGLHAITSPFVGTFYSSSAPGKPNYVKVGDKISKGQTLCILEAMKIMNEIESDVSGEVVEICVENESLVEYGQTILKVRV